VKTEERIGYDIWTTEENAKQSVLKCVSKIIEDFMERDTKWNLTKSAVAKAILKRDGYSNKTEQ
jgi:hypothetical protein